MKPRCPSLFPAVTRSATSATCLDSIIAGDFPLERLEILVVDGMSDDGTRDQVRSYAERYPVVRMLDNPKKITPAAMNVGIKKRTR